MRFAFVCLILLSGQAFCEEDKLDYYRCGYSTIRYNATNIDVVKGCGKSHKPSSVKRIGIVYYRIKDKVYHQYYDEAWSFEQYGRFRHYLYFVDGKVSLITEDRSIRD